MSERIGSRAYRYAIVHASPAAAARSRQPIANTAASTTALDRTAAKVEVFEDISTPRCQSVTTKTNRYRENVIRNTLYCPPVQLVIVEPRPKEAVFPPLPASATASTTRAAASSAPCSLGFRSASCRPSAVDSSNGTRESLRESD